MELEKEFNISILMISRENQQVGQAVKYWRTN
jgi:hypothetical protein